MDDVLVDSSVWVEHFRTNLAGLNDLWTADRITLHTVIIGELAVGNLPDRPRTLTDLRTFRRVIELRPDAVYDFVERHNLYGVGLSWGDVQILASAVVSGIPLWTFDKRLSGAAANFSILWPPP